MTVAGDAAILIGPVAVTLPVDELFPGELAIDPGLAIFATVAEVFGPDVAVELEGRTIRIGGEDVPRVIA